jgi:hypothetical protein
MKKDSDKFIENNIEIEELTYHAAVDIPKINPDGTPSDEWYCIDYFKDKKEAIAYAMKHFGADENGMVCLISTF